MSAFAKAAPAVVTKVDSTVVPGFFPAEDAKALGALPQLTTMLTVVAALTPS